jgi:hypothetical protein
MGYSISRRGRAFHLSKPIQLLHPLLFYLLLFPSLKTICVQRKSAEVEVRQFRKEKDKREKLSPEKGRQQ